MIYYRKTLSSGGPKLTAVHSVEAIRYYEQQGLLEKSARSDSNYRHFGSEAEKRLRFIVQCRLLDMGMKEIGQLLHLADTPEANCAEVDELLDKHIAKVREQLKNLAKLEKSLKVLRSDCAPLRTGQRLWDFA